MLLVVRRVHASGSGLRAELIYGDNNTTMNLPLDVDETYDVDTGYYTVHIQIKDGAARFWIRPARITSVKLWLAFQRRPDRHLPSGPCSADHCTCFLTKRSGFE